MRRHHTAFQTVVLHLAASEFPAALLPQATAQPYSLK